MQFTWFILAALTAVPALARPQAVPSGCPGSGEKECHDHFASLCPVNCMTAAQGPGGLICNNNCLTNAATVCAECAKNGAWS